LEEGNEEEHAMKIEKAVLAYSGGLDTSVIIPWLKENYGCRVIACLADLGQGDNYRVLKARALKSGAEKVYVRDLKDEFARDYLFPLIKSGAIYEGRYLLGTSIARPLIAKWVAETAIREKADALVHGATGKGNDQVRFELTFKSIAPQMKIIAPWREWDLKSRQDEIEYAREHNIPVPVTKKEPYSRDGNLWHLSHEGGILENPWNEPEKNMFKLTNDPEKAPGKPEYVELGFEKGVPVSINGKKLSPVALIEKLNKIAGRHGVGRVDIVENRLVGMKSRGVYETPAGTVIYIAHKDLESITVDRETMRYKEMVSIKYAELVYYGQWFSHLREALDKFIDSTQKYVTGTVRVKLCKGSCVVTGRKSPYSLYNPELATFEAEKVYEQADAKGFIELFGLPLKVEALRRKGTH